MRKLLAVASAAALLAACGSSSSSSSAPGPVTGTIGGKAFTPVDVQAIQLSSSNPCGIPTPTQMDPSMVTTMGVRAMELKLTSYAGACGDLTSTTCIAHGGQQALTLLVVRLNTLPPFAPPTTLAGDYTAYPSLTTFVPEPQNPGVAHVAWAAVVDPDPTCAGTTAEPHAVTTGTVHIAQDATTINGSVDLRFDDGSSASGTFSAPLCGGTPGGGDVCSLATSLAATQQLCTGFSCP